jgi:hypothetical protein
VTSPRTSTFTSAHSPRTSGTKAPSALDPQPFGRLIRFWQIAPDLLGLDRLHLLADHSGLLRPAAGRRLTHLDACQLRQQIGGPSEGHPGGASHQSLQGARRQVGGGQTKLFIEGEKAPARRSDQLASSSFDLHDRPSRRLEASLLAPPRLEHRPTASTARLLCWWCLRPVLAGTDLRQFCSQVGAQRPQVRIQDLFHLQQRGLGMLLPPLLVGRVHRLTVGLPCAVGVVWLHYRVSVYLYSRTFLALLPTAKQ